MFGFLRCVVGTFTKIILVGQDGITPQKAYDGRACYDVYSTISTIISSGKRKLIPIDVGDGVIDSSYRDEIELLIINDSLQNFYNLTAKSSLVDELSDSERGYGGFGSTGK